MALDDEYVIAQLLCFLYDSWIFCNTPFYFLNIWILGFSVNFMMLGFRVDSMVPFLFVSIIFYKLNSWD